MDILIGVIGLAGWLAAVAAGAGCLALKTRLECADDEVRWLERAHAKDIEEISRLSRSLWEWEGAGQTDEEYRTRLMRAVAKTQPRGFRGRFRKEAEKSAREAPKVVRVKETLADEVKAKIAGFVAGREREQQAGNIDMSNVIALQIAAAVSSDDTAVAQVAASTETFVGGGGDFGGAGADGGWDSGSGSCGVSDSGSYSGSDYSSSSSDGGGNGGSCD